nr:hypothetical protein Ccrd_022478 [Ipomoea batatas]
MEKSAMGIQKLKFHLMEHSAIAILQGTQMGFDWVELIPSFNPGDHGVGEFDERGLLEERDDLFLPEYPLVLFPQIHKWVACLAVVDVWQPCLDSQPQMVTYHLPGVPLQRLNELRGRIIIRNVEPETVRHGGRNPLPETERVAAYEIRALPVRLVQSVEEKRRRWTEQILDVLVNITKKKQTYKAVIINGEDILLLGDHVAEATASGILKGYARGPRSENLVNVVTVIELIVETRGDFNGPGRIAVLDDDEMVGLEKRPPHFEEIEHVVLFLPGSSPLFYELSEQYEDVLPRLQSPPVIRVGKNLETYLVGFVLNVDNFAVPGTNVGSHELIDFREELISDHGRADEGQQCPSHVFMSRAMNRCNIAFSQNVKHGLRVSWDKPFALIHKNVSVYLWIHGNHCGALFKELSGFTKERPAHGSRGEPFFMNLSSFHLNKAVLRMMQRPKTATKTTMKTAINGLPGSFQVPTTLRGRYGGLGWVREDYKDTDNGFRILLNRDDISIVIISPILKLVWLMELVLEDDGLSWDGAGGPEDGDVKESVDSLGDRRMGI